MIRLPAGLVDAGASSLATFFAGVAASRLLNSSELGAYALLFSAWLLLSQLPAQLVLVPAEAQLVRFPTASRSGFLARNTKTALPYVLLGSALVPATLLFVPEGVDRLTSLQLGGSAAVVTCFFPLQEHARRLLHLSRLHWSAAWVSITRLVIASVVLLTGWSLGIAPGWLPFGCLAIGDALAFGLSLLLVGKRSQLSLPYNSRSLVASGKWLLISASIGPAAGFLVGVLVANLADAAALGTAEAARVGAQPVLVLAVGLSAVLRPTSMESALNGDEASARRMSRRLFGGLAVASLVYVGLVALPEGLNLLEALIPAAFTMPGLLELSILAALLNGAVFLQRAELIAMDETSSLAKAEGYASLGRLAVAAPAGALQAWTVPLSFLAGGAIRWMAFARTLRRSYSRYHSGSAR